MKEVTVRLYEYGELSENAKERVREWWVSTDMYPWHAENRNVIDVLQRVFDIRLVGWEYSSWRSSRGTVRFGDRWTDEQLALTGERARSFLWNRLGRLLLQPRVSYRGGRRRESSLFMTRVYDGTCPLTGYGLDCDALDPLACFCFGVEWDDGLKRRVMVPHERRGSWKYTTVEDIVCACCDSLFEAIREDVEWHESEESLVDACEANEWMFDENGKRWVEPAGRRHHG